MGSLGLSWSAGSQLRYCDLGVVATASVSDMAVSLLKATSAAFLLLWLLLLLLLLRCC